MVEAVVEGPRPWAKGAAEEPVVEAGSESAVEAAAVEAAMRSRRGDPGSQDDNCPGQEQRSADGNCVVEHGCSSSR